MKFNNKVTLTISSCIKQLMSLLFKDNFDKTPTFTSSKWFILV